MEKIGYTVKPFTLSDAKYVMIAAIEGGIDYWLYQDSEVDDNPSNQNLIKGGDWESTESSVEESYYFGVEFDFEGKHYKVTIEDFVEKAEEFSKKFPRLPIDLDSHDALSADAFFQYCAFGEIVFG